MKFDSGPDAWLYAQTPDDEIGSAEDFGYYGLYVGPFEPTPEEIGEFELSEDDILEMKAKAGAILNEDTYGFVYVLWYDDRETMEDEWSSLAQQYDEYFESFEEGEA